MGMSQQELRFILKIGLTELADGLDMGDEGRGEEKGGIRTPGLNT